VFSTLGKVWLERTKTSVADIIPELNSKAVLLIVTSECTSANVMAHLPTEILSMICKRCDFITRKQLRFTFRAFGEIATKNVFHTVYVALLQPSVKKTKLIAEHPTLSRYVRKLIICPELLPEYDDQQSWEQRIDIRPFPRSFDGDHPVEVGIWDIGTSRPVDWTMENVHFYNYSGKEVPRTSWLALPKHNLSAAELRRGYQSFYSMVQG